MPHKVLAPPIKIGLPVDWQPLRRPAFFLPNRWVVTEKGVLVLPIMISWQKRCVKSAIMVKTGVITMYYRDSMADWKICRRRFYWLNWTFAQRKGRCVNTARKNTTACFKDEFMCLMLNRITA